MSKHLELVRAVNSATTEREHDLAEARLRGWREGVEHCGRRWDYIAADEDTEDIYPGRPYCCGVLLDWTPKPKFANVFCSQCGQEFGPGDHGFSHCENHKRHNAEVRGAPPTGGASHTNDGLGAAVPPAPTFEREAK